MPMIKRASFDAITGETSVIEVEDTRVVTVERRLVPKSLIISRLTDQQVADAIALLTPKQAERWRVSDKPSVYFDDPEVLAILQAVGADAAIVMAEEEYNPGWVDPGSSVPSAVARP